MSAEPALSSPPPVFLLDEPHYHRVRLGEANRFRGVALAVDGPELSGVTVHREGIPLLEIGIDRPSPELASIVRSPPADRRRFEFGLVVDGGAAYEIRGKLADGGERTLFLYDAPFAQRERDRLSRLWTDASRRPAPPPELVEATQGGRNVDAYRDSIVSGLISLESLLRDDGVAPESVEDILDVGCGTGRLLVGWSCDGRGRRLTGVDIDAQVVGWNRDHLQGVARWEVGELHPPLDLPDDRFDLVQLVSVFTHLPLSGQREWLAEIRRLLRPGGAAIVTLHGDIYASLLLDAAGRDSFQRSGYVERPGGPEGGRGFATFHSPGFARELFRDFGRVSWYPRGAPEHCPPRLFPIASLQDVYVLRSSQTMS